MHRGLLVLQVIPSKVMFFNQDETIVSIFSPLIGTYAKIDRPEVMHQPKRSLS